MVKRAEIPKTSRKTVLPIGKILPPPKPREKKVPPPAEPPPREADGRIKKGFSLNPAGRPKGLTDRISKLTSEERKVLMDKYDMTPLEFLLSVMSDPDEFLGYRMDAAKTAAPYMHRKMPIAIEGGDTPIMLYDTAALAKLSDRELANFTAIMAKLVTHSQKEDGE